MEQKESGTANHMRILKVDVLNSAASRSEINKLVYKKKYVDDKMKQNEATQLSFNIEPDNL